MVEEVVVVEGGGSGWLLLDFPVAADAIFRRRMLCRRSGSPFRKYSLANSHLSGTTFRNPCTRGGSVKKIIHNFYHAYS